MCCFFLPGSPELLEKGEKKKSTQRIKTTPRTLLAGQREGERGQTERFGVPAVSRGSAVAGPASPSLAVFAVGAGTRFPPRFPALLGLRVRAGLSFLHGRALVPQPVPARAVQTQLSAMVACKGKHRRLPRPLRGRGVRGAFSSLSTEPGGARCDEDVIHPLRLSVGSCVLAP